jgi:aminomethyltransferase
MPLYGHELTRQINPLQAGLGFAVDLDKGPFPGREILLESSSSASHGAGAQPIRVGLSVEGKRIPRQDAAVLLGDPPRQGGYVTSGTFSPTLERVIAMAYVEPGLATEGTKLKVDIRGHHADAQVVRLPFYSRAGR